MRYRFLLRSSLLLVFLLFLGATPVLAVSSGLESGTIGVKVSNLQRILIHQGYLHTQVTGFYGPATKKAVQAFQKAHGLETTGAVGPKTLSLLRKYGYTSSTSRGGQSRDVSGDQISQDPIEMLPWFGKVEDIFPRGMTATVIDVNTGLEWHIKRIMGHNHADCETPTSDDTATMKKAFGGEWNWSRRAVIVVIPGHRLAASIAGMPHADDSISDNAMSGHFDVHFLGSRTHGSDRVDPDHQAMVHRAAESNR